MKIYPCSDPTGRVTEIIDLDEQEAAAIEKAHIIAASRFVEAGVEYTEGLREQVEWCFLGAIRIGGIPELMRYVTEAKIAGKKKTIYAGYASTQEMEVRK